MAGEPDPSQRTVEQLAGAVAGLKQLHETRLDAMDKAIAVAHEDLVRVPTEVQKSVGSLRELCDEKFDGVEKQFSERDTRADKTAELNQKALDAALLTAEKSVAKSELSFTKQIEAIQKQLSDGVKANDDKFGDIQRQIARIDNALSAILSRSSGHGDVIAYVVAGVAVIGLVVTILIHFAK